MIVEKLSFRDLEKPGLPNATITWKCKYGVIFSVHAYCIVTTACPQ
jgi:hypothetical protein